MPCSRIRCASNPSGRPGGWSARSRWARANVPLKVKVVLIWRAAHLLSAESADPDFADLFRQPFEDELPRDDDNTRLYARDTTTLIRSNGLRPFDRRVPASSSMGRTLV